MRKQIRTTLRNVYHYDSAGNTIKVLFAYGIFHCFVFQVGWTIISTAIATIFTFIMMSIQLAAMIEVMYMDAFGVSSKCY